jgi:hypothetical protein
MSAPDHYGPPWDTTRDASEFEPLCYDHGGGNLTANALARTCSHPGCTAVTFGVRGPWLAKAETTTGGE